tara:strand:- start:233 stop:868 length:636 start_codon:yes stop_codon:yes gene_type:complete
MNENLESIITFNDREADLRSVLTDLRDKKGTSILSLANEIGVNEKVLRDFLKENSTVSLSKQNYKKIVSFFAQLSLDYVRTKFHNLVNLLKGTKKENIKWDFETDFSENQVESYKELKDFLINGDDCLWEVVNKSDGDVFDNYAAISKKKEEFEKAKGFLDIYIYGAEPRKFLWSTDSKESRFYFIDKKLAVGKEEGITVFGGTLFNPKLK